MRQIRKSRLRLALLSLLLFLGIGYAVFRTALEIDGTVNIARTSWDVHFENVSVTQGSVSAYPAPVTDNTTTTEMTYTIGFTKPGDFYEFTVDRVNDGTIDAMVNFVLNNTYSSNGTTSISLPSYLTSTVTYNDGIAIEQNQLLAHNTSEKIKVRVEFKKDITTSDLPSSGNTTVVFKFLANYKQADDNAVLVRQPANFVTDSWDKIIESYENETISQLREDMENGTTREVQLDMDFDGEPETTAHLRIANLSTPDECEIEGFSQTACGFVVEFADIIKDFSMNYNPSTSPERTGEGTRGGWYYTKMRAYLNGGIYKRGTTVANDYTNIGIIDTLPDDLRNIIIPTFVVSGHGTYGTTSTTSTDYLYLLAPHEVWLDADGDITKGIDRYDTSYNLTRQLDYYASKEVTTTTNYSEAIKYNKNNAAQYWWLRSAISNSHHNFYEVNRDGAQGNYSSSTSHGVSPAFRIAIQNS